MCNYNIPNVVFIGAKDTGKSTTINNLWENSHNKQPFIVSEYIEGRGQVDYKVVELPYIPFTLKEETENWQLSNKDILKTADVIVFVVSVSDITINRRAHLLSELRSKDFVKDSATFVLAISGIEEYVNIEELNNIYTISLEDVSSLFYVRDLFFNEISRYTGNIIFSIDKAIPYSYRAKWQLANIKNAIVEGVIKRHNEIMFDELLPTIVFIGKTGCGKSSTINTLCGTDLPVDGAVACTKFPIVIKKMITIGDKTTELNIVDLPGIAESLEANMLYEDYYATYIRSASVVVCLSQANTRAYTQDEEFYKKMIEAGLITKNTNLILGINKIDLLFKSEENISGIDLSTITDKDPLIVDKINDYYNNVFANIFSDFENVNIDSVVVYSNMQRWNLETLKKHIFNFLNH